jgi:hypothetical protein
MKNEDFIAFVDVLTNLAELHEWEIKNFPLLNSLTGRLLYYRIAQRAIQSEKNHTNTIKDLIGDSGFTEKSLSATLHQAGFITVATMKRPHCFDLWVIASKSPASKEDIEALAKAHFPIA